MHRKQKMIQTERGKEENGTKGGDSINRMTGRTGRLREGKRKEGLT
jgi:hypothetical protein